MPVSAKNYVVTIEPLYWQATESVDWVLNNNLNSINQQISYSTADFDFRPGLRISASYKRDWDFRVTYTTYYTKASDSASGNLVATFMGGKMIQNGNFFYTSGQLNFKINFNTLDLDFGKTFYFRKRSSYRPYIGLKNGWIYQEISTNLRGATSIVEDIHNNFIGIGPRMGLSSNWRITRTKNFTTNGFMDVSMSYLAGRWSISDVVTASNATNLYTNAGHRYLGAAVIQGLIGFSFDYKSYMLSIGYEISDWFNQCQVFSDASGTQNNDLILQGLTLQLTYSF